MRAMVFSEKGELAAQIATILRERYEIDIYTTSDSPLDSYGAKVVFRITGNHFM